MTTSNTTPRIGQIVTVYGIQCRIVVIHPAGTVDVSSLDGKRHYRVSGLGVAA